jgi:hypothetical protein
MRLLTVIKTEAGEIAELTLSEITRMKQSNIC